MARTLTDAELALIRQWTRRARIWFWILLPIGVGVSVGGLALGMRSFFAGQWITGLVPSVAGLAVGGLFCLWRGSIATYRNVDSSTRLATRSGLLHRKRIGRSYATCIDELAVVFVSDDVRRAVELDAPCVVEVILDAPVLVITARPATSNDVARL